MHKKQLRETLVQELLAAGDAASRASEAGDELPHRVHKFRKALRRACATLDLVAESIPSRSARAALRTFRDARRAVSTARDYTVVSHVLGQLVLEDAHRATANEILAAAAVGAPDASMIEQTLRAGAVASVAAIVQVSELVPSQIRWSVLREGLKRIYREARCARRDAKDDHQTFHTWRRRTKELSYQLELLGYPAELDELIDAQSHVVDLIMVSGFIKAHAERTDSVASLVDFLEQQTAAQMILARRAGRDHFHAKPKAYVRAIRHWLSGHDNVTSPSPTIASPDTSGR